MISLDPLVYGGVPRQAVLRNDDQRYEASAGHRIAARQQR